MAQFKTYKYAIGRKSGLPRFALEFHDKDGLIRAAPIDLEFGDNLDGCSLESICNRSNSWLRDWLDATQISSHKLKRTRLEITKNGYKDITIYYKRHRDEYIECEAETRHYGFD